MRVLLHFAGFHRQPSSGLLRGLLCLEVCKSRSASGIGLEITTFRQSYFFVLSFALFCRRTENIFVFCVIGTHRSQHIAAEALQKFNICDFVASTKAFIAKAGIACEQWETLSAVVRPANTCMETSLNRLNY